MSSLIVVGISDQRVTRSPDILITYALGSCVGICLHDAALRIAGLAHILLPTAIGGTSQTDLFKYADTAIETMLGCMERQGCSRYRITAKIAGGAAMFATTGIGIGERNIGRVKLELERLNLRLLAEDTGLNYGRTVEFNPETGAMTVKSVGRGIKTL